MSRFQTCKYKELFGIPGEGAHAFRLGNIAVVDVLASILLAWLLSSKFTQRGLSFEKSLLLVFLFGIAAHRVFCVRTTVDKFLFPNK